MQTVVIRRIQSSDQRFKLPAGAGSDAVHSDPEYCLAVTELQTETSLKGSGFALTLGQGNRLVCEAIDLLAQPLIGKPIEEVMASFGAWSKQLADDPILRWLGPHKGVVHLALSSITNACFDLWAKSRGVPLWKLLLDLSPEQVINTLDLSYLEDVLSPEEALHLLREQVPTRQHRMGVVKAGYPGYDTSVGWMAYDDDKVRALTQHAVGQGFTAFKLKVGSPDRERDLRRAAMLRECAGDSGTVMFDANQQWSLPVAQQMCRRLSEFHPLWIEEPTHPDDVFGHQLLAREIAPIGIAAGEHIPNRIVFKNFLQAESLTYVQADCTRLAGVSEFIAVSLLAKKFGKPIVPHVGDMGQIHQHLVLFNHVALDHEALLLEHIPHLQKHFSFPAQVKGGHYEIPSEPGASTDLIAMHESSR